MIKLNAILLDYEPRRKILSKLPAAIHREPEMSEWQSAFLCGAIKQSRPKKILEVGVAGGATTAIILQALEDRGVPYEMHSVDIAEKFYHNTKYNTGFLGLLAKENVFGNLRGTHKFYLGKFLPQVIDEIGGDIDFVVLDTVHALPGEILDFLAMLPYLKESAVVVLHDVSFNQSSRHRDWFSNAILFSAVTAEKFLNFNENDFFRYPNISAFQINEKTSQSIDNLFLSLIVSWSYFPSEAELVTYRRHYQRFYSEELCEIFQEAIDMNAFNFYLAQLAQRK